MTDRQHPITPPQCLINQWWEDAPEDDELEFTKYVAIKAAQWGSDQELEECCAWLDEHLAYENNVTNNLRADRRPKPKSLKQQAIDELVAAYNADQMDDTTFETLGRIIKSLPD